MEIDFSGGAYESFSKRLNAQECINFFTHIDQEGGVSTTSLRATPGLKEWCDLGSDLGIRGCKVFSNRLYAVSGNSVYQVGKDKNVVTCDNNLDTYDGTVSMDNTATQLMVVDGISGYIIFNDTIYKIVDEDFPKNPQTVTEQDNYFLVTRPDSGRINISDLANGRSWDGTNFFNEEADPDDAIAVMSSHSDIVVWGEKTMNFYYNSGATVPFDEKPGTFQEIGIGAKFSPALLDNTIFFLTDKFQVARINGYNPLAVSNKAIEYQIASLSRKDDAVGMGITIEGNPFYIITFPEANKTLAYNAATNFWHELASYPSPYNNRWRGQCCEYFDGKWIVGDHSNGKLYELDFDTFTDNGELIKRTRTTKAIKSEGKNIFHHRLEVFFEPGTGLVSGQGSDPQAMLRYSDDACETWSHEIWRSTGKIGEYKNQIVWDRLGASRYRNYQLSVTDPVKWAIINANLDTEVGIS